MKLDLPRVVNALKQFRRRSLQFATAAALALLAAGFALDPTEPLGAVCMSLSTGVLASVVVAAAALEREDFAQSVLDMGVQHLFDDRKSEFDDTYWLRLLREANSSFRVLGVANHGYLNDAQAAQESREAFLEAIAKQKAIELLWLRPDNNPAAVMREQEEGRTTRRDIVNAILYFWDIREELSGPGKEKLRLMEYVGLPTCGITWADNQLVVTHYLSGRLNLRAPGFVLGSSLFRFDRFVSALGTGGTTSPPLAQVYARNYREVASKASEITEGRIDELKRFRDTLPAGPSEADFRAEGGDVDA